MEVQALVNIISTVGFPIAACFYMANLLTKFNAVAQQVTVTLKGIEDHLGSIDSRLDKLEED